MDSFRGYILINHKDDLIRVMETGDDFNNYSINVDFLKLFETDPILGDGILCNPKNILPKCDDALVQIQKELVDQVLCTKSVRSTVKMNIRARFYGLPVCPELHRITVPKNDDLGCFIKLTGTAIRITQSKMLEYRKNFKCSRCHYIQLVEGKYEHRYVIKAPGKCNNPDIQCRSNNMSPVHDVTRDNCRDYQELKIQEQVNKLTVGGIPGSIWVTLEDDLVDCCKPGDDVSICGTVTRRWHPVLANKKSEVELVFRANHIEVCNAQKSIAVSLAPDVKIDFEKFWSTYKNFPMRGRDVILASVCPKVYGLYMVKLALTLTVITGCNYNHDVDRDILDRSILTEKSDRNVRGQCHLLLVGDPGTGKSQLLKAAAMLTSRSVLTSGSGSTKAGLTCTALREDGEWQLEAGALVLADGGACCIDELAQMREHDRASIHEAMEQQTISVAKAGIICKLNTRCAVIAACNPKGNYDTEQPLSINVSLGTPLLSRFDLIFILLDTQTHNWDKLVADYILYGNIMEMPNLKSWPLEKLQLYLSLIGPYDVTMSQKSTEILQAYYVKQRRSENRDPSRTTVRMLDSLVRLSQAHARLMNRHKVHTMDAITAVMLMDLSMQDCILTGSSDAIQSTFQKYPDFHYLKSAQRILSNLCLYEIWENELLFYSQLLKVDKQQLDSNIENDIYDLFKIDNNVSDNPNECPDIVVESSYFKSSEKNLISNDILKIDNLDIKINNNSQDELNSNDVALEDPCNSTTSKLLAKTIKKHSMLNHNKNTMCHSRLITGKTRKSKRKNESTAAKENVIMVNPKPAKRKRISKSNIKEKITKAKSSDQKITVIEVNKCNSSSEDEIDEVQMLNYLPSVNDPFHDLNINFSVIEEDSDEQDEIVKEKDILADLDEINIENNVDKEIVKKIISPVNVNVLSKLEKFAYTSRDTSKSDIGDFDSLLNKSNENSIDCLAKVINKSDSNISNGSSGILMKNFSTESLKMPSQRSLFESDSDIFSDFDDDIEIDTAKKKPKLFANKNNKIQNVASTSSDRIVNGNSKNDNLLADINNVSRKLKIYKTVNDIPTTSNDEIESDIRKNINSRENHSKDIQKVSQRSMFESADDNFSDFDL